MNPIKLGINIDHIATLRQVRGTPYPDPLQAAFIVEKAGADGLTLHLREDRRHIQDSDVEQIRQQISIPMNLEMAVTEEMIRFAEKIRPPKICLVPEKREELTTEGGLDVKGNFEVIKNTCERLAKISEVSLFIDPDLDQIKAAQQTGAPVIEIHTGAYAELLSGSPEQEKELKRIITAAAYAASLGLIVNAGHGLHYENTARIAAIAEINELNIGHAIVAEALFIGFESAIIKMKALIRKARVV